MRYELAIWANAAASTPRSAPFRRHQATDSVAAFSSDMGEHLLAVHPSVVGLFAALPMVKG